MQIKLPYSKKLMLYCLVSFYLSYFCYATVYTHRPFHTPNIQLDLESFARLVCQEKKWILKRIHLDPIKTFLDPSFSFFTYDQSFLVICLFRAIGENAIQVTKHLLSTYPLHDKLSPITSYSLLVSAIDNDATLETIQIILEHHPHFHSKDDYGNTALHLATLKDQPKIVLKLIEAGADVKSICNFQNQTALECIQERWFDIESILTNDLPLSIIQKNSQNFEFILDVLCVHLTQISKTARISYIKEILKKIESFKNDEYTKKANNVLSTCFPSCLI